MIYMTGLYVSGVLIVWLVVMCFFEAKKYEHLNMHDYAGVEDCKNAQTVATIFAALITVIIFYLHLGDIIAEVMS